MAGEQAAVSLREKIPWTKFGFESVLIIASILIAFSIEEWRQARNDAQLEQTLLEALDEDFELAARRLESVKDAHNSVARYTELLILQSDSGEVAESDRAEVERAVGGPFRRTMFQPPMGTVETILGSGRIDLISNKVLVTELTQWSSVVERLTTLQLETRDHFYERIYPYLAANLNIKDLDKGYRQFLSEYPFEQKPVDVSGLLEDEEYIGMIYMHWVLQTNALNRIVAVETSLESIRSIISEELGNAR